MAMCPLPATATKMTNLRRATIDDAQAIAAVGHHFWNEHHYSRFGDYIEENAVEALTTFLSTEGVAMWLYEEDDIKGFLCLVKVPVFWSNFFSSSELLWWVHRDVRKKGVGQQLLAEAKVWARENGCSLIEAHNHKGKRLVIDV